MEVQTKDALLEHLLDVDILVRFYVLVLGGPRLGRTAAVWS